MTTRSDRVLIRYYTNCFDGHICSNQPCSPDSLPVIGYFTGNEDLLHIQWLIEHQETGPECDEYEESVSVDQVPLSTDEKRTILSEKKQEKPLVRLSDIYKKVSIHSISDLLDQMQTFYQAGRVFSLNVFAPLNTPQEFNYTGVFLVNNAHQGVLHSFLRHYLQWQILVPFIGVTLQKLKPLHLFIELVAKAPNLKTSRTAISNFVAALNSLDRAEFNDCQSALNEVQVEMVKHLQKKLIFGNYRGEGLNEKSQMEVYFHIQEGLIVVLGFSRELFKAETMTLMDSRPIRALVTAYFIEPEEHSKRIIVKSY